MQTLADLVDTYQNTLDWEVRTFLDQAVEKIVSAKKKGGKVFVATGSGPNIHEGVTTFIASLMAKGLVDSVSTSSAVIAHEMGGTLDRVRRVNGLELGIPRHYLPKGDLFEFTLLSPDELQILRQEMEIDDELFERGFRLPGSEIIKAAGNMAYPMGLRTERLAREILSLSHTLGLPFETVAGWGADHRTMIGAGAALGKPVLVSIPQLVGGGGVGIAIADSISIAQRCGRLAQILNEADVIIESAVALTQEIHDGPFETYTGHGIWASWDGYPTYSLKNKTLIRIDLDSNLKRAWEMQRNDQMIQNAVDQGLPKTKLTGIPFRMEMSGFARLESSLPLIGDIGVIWPVLFGKVAQALDIPLDFISHPQQTLEGIAMREWIVETVKPINRKQMLAKSQNCCEVL
jgi:hypothetical protein